jgi:hypothetical protein
MKVRILTYIWCDSKVLCYLSLFMRLFSGKVLLQSLCYGWFFASIRESILYKTSSMKCLCQIPDQMSAAFKQLVVSERNTKK